MIEYVYSMYDPWTILRFFCNLVRSIQSNYLSIPIVPKYACSFLCNARNFPGEFLLQTYSTRRKRETINLHFSLIATIGRDPRLTLLYLSPINLWLSSEPNRHVRRRFIRRLSYPLLGHFDRRPYRRSSGLPDKLSRLNTFPLPLLTFRYHPPLVATPQ